MDRAKRRSLLAVTALSLLFLGFLAGYAWRDFFIPSGLYHITTENGGHSAPGDTSGNINPNTATRAELMDLPGVGPAIADRILASRENDGFFSCPEDLLRVQGIGEKTLEKMRDYLTFS